MKRGLYILIILFVSIQVLAQKNENQSIALNSTASTLRILPKFNTYAPDFLDELASPQKSEYMYTALRFGMSHGYSVQPVFNEFKYLNTPVGDMQAIPSASFFAYVPGFVADLYYHFDFVTENAGIFVGLEYNYYGISSKYETKSGGYSAVEKNMTNSIGVPLAFKFWPKLYKNQQYIYVGLKYSFNLTMSSVQKVSWEEAMAVEKIDAEQFRRSNFGFFLGFNYLVFNIQLDYVPGNLFNMDYIDETVSPKPLYLGQPEKMFFISRS